MAIATQDINPLTGRWQVLAGVAVLHTILLFCATRETPVQASEASVISTVQARVIAALPPVVEPPAARPATPAITPPAIPRVTPRPTPQVTPRAVSQPPPAAVRKLPAPRVSPAEPSVSRPAPDQPAAASIAAATSQPPATPTPTPRVTPARYDAEYLQNPAPAYPTFARRRHEEGRVLVLVTVSPEGLATRVRLKASSGHDTLDESALATVATWRFSPARQGDTAISSDVVVPVTFSLR
jgi:protein TonB